MQGGREDGEAARLPDSTNSSSTATPSQQPQSASEAASHPLMPSDRSDSDAESADMDVSASEDEAEAAPAPAPRPLPAMPLPSAAPPTTAGLKRKMSDVVTNGASPAAREHELPKKPRLSPPATQHGHPESSPASSVKTEIWQHILSYLPPAALGRCLRVSKTFNHVLTAVRGDEGKRAKKQGDPALAPMDSNKLWANARKIWFRDIPKPLAGFTELQMLQLVGGLSCQFCRRPPLPSLSTSILDAGPGLDGMRVIWPFRVRSCGKCLQGKTKTDIQLLSGPAGTLASGLPPAFMTSSMHYISEAQKQASGGMPKKPGLQISKVYYVPDINQIVAEFEEALALNSGDEWRKGLLSRGKEAMADASRWDKWESTLPRGSTPANALREYDLDSFPGYRDEKRKSLADNPQPAAVTTNGRSPGHALPPAPHFAPVPAPTQPPAAMDHRSVFPSVPQPEPVQHWSPQPARPAMEAEQRRQARKEEIERRCRELNPPLDPALLPYMDAFQKAMLIAQPLNDQAWEALKPRILAQREAVELEAHRRAEQLAALGAGVNSSSFDQSLKPAKEIFGKHYDMLQEPFRRRLVEYVDEFVNASWNGHPNLDAETNPVFAARAILHVQRRYKEDKAAGVLPPVVEVKGKADAEDLPEPFLSLDNAKWLFENKIRPYLAGNDRNIFVCAGCYEENPYPLKWLAFEGLIQHYGARHTSAFSRDNAVVYWQLAEWPEEPPFFQQPEKLIKPRKNQGWKGRGNAKNTPQPRRDGMFNAPPASQNGHYPHQQQQQQQHHMPYQGGHYHNAQPYFPQQSYAQSHEYGQYPSYEVANGSAIPEADKANQFAADFREIWDALDGVSDALLNCIRLQVAIHHATSRFMDKYRSSPSLDLLTDALATNPIMEPIKAATGLVCKQCVSNSTDGTAGYQSYYGRIKSAKLYNTNTLVKHFQITHAPKMPHHIWTRDVLELPETQMVKDLSHAPGMDAEKLKLIAETFPAAFPGQGAETANLPTAPPLGAGVASGLSVASKLMERLTKKNQEPQQQNRKRKKGKHGRSSVPGARDGSHDAEPQEHEYDPRRPMTAAAEDEEAIAARFDSDIARRKEAATARPDSIGAQPGLAGLTPETLRALQALTAGAAPQQTGCGRVERAPSVGREDYGHPAAPPPPPSSNGAAVQPDISAILASLTGGSRPQVSTPTAGPERAGSISRSAHRAAHQDASPGSGGPDQLYHSLAQTYGPPPPRHVESQRPATSTAYAPPTPSPQYANAPGSDLQAALERNARRFERNSSHQLPQPAAPAYAAPQMSPPHHVAPPRYAPGYGYEDRQAPPPPQQVYGGYAPPPQQPPQHIYQPQQRTVYVDEHGREIQLVPVEAAPQYAPPPPPQQQQQVYGGYYGSGGGEQEYGQGYYGGR